MFYEQSSDSPKNSFETKLYKKEDKTEFNKMVKQYINFYATIENYQNEEIQKKLINLNK